MRGPVPIPALLLAATLGAASSCLVDLEPGLNCGDNFIDALADENCEPGLPDSVAGRCGAGKVPGPGACDPVTCRFRDELCTSCGNGVVDAGEQCDPAAMSQPTCVGEGTATCRSDCTIDLSGCAECGNGVVDLDEECDPAVKPGDITGVVDCADLDSPYGPSRYYGSGTSTRCTSDCTWDRSHCLYCRNTRLESDEVAGDIYVDFEKKISPVPEVCDKDAEGALLYDENELVEYCQTEVCGSNFRVKCAADCKPDCTDFTAVPPSEPVNCCTAQGEDCPYNSITGQLEEGREPCCWALEHPDDDPCQPVSVGANLFVLCR